MGFWCSGWVSDWLRNLLYDGILTWTVEFFDLLFNCVSVLKTFFHCPCCKDNVTAIHLSMVVFCGLQKQGQWLKM